ncbi:MAG TPA: prepilin-type N-terminal cleavage/methylation domain-containing protein [Phycisphaerales bacterium]|nr:prepilin-type N-terminal cleavage/methylation domain-containing protein [Phycisphaerales bacterium]
MEVRLGSGVRGPDGGRSRGFTLIELLIVIVILGILAALALAIANRVAVGGKERLTKNLIQVLDQALAAHEAGDRGLPAFYTDPEGNSFPLVDGRLATRAPTKPFDRVADPSQPALSLCVFLLTEAAGDSGKFLQGIDPDLVKKEEVAAWGWPQAGGAIAAFGPGTGSNGPLGTVIHDGFGFPLRFSHPRFDGPGGAIYRQDNGGPWTRVDRPDIDVPAPPVPGQPARPAAAFSRSTYPFNPDAPPNVPNPVGDSDEGTSAGGRGYFYSVGADGNPGTHADNVYTTAPLFPSEAKTRE